ncbi:conserved hypothetical protein [Xenorhabdus bovienii str. puntauvense]|uniref:DUF2591 domain-containing protein n=1 Tax=Xenorhabdus bovienii str. puntauvense TaxID=1398201 RepID=A0A077NA14_XENBV|nr:phage protein NinX family protein [Xenorhabdus bovienii]CDG95849.1 conserved hypothetical protein [Xenorhabdus bovienii str. puntauvense]
MKIKTSELTGRALDWAVCLAIGGAANKDNTEVQAPNRDYYLLSNGKGNFAPSTDWSQCGELIDEYGIQLIWVSDATIEASSHLMNKLVVSEFGSNHLESACRLIVLGKLGDEVDIPDELVEGV